MNGDRPAGLYVQYGCGWCAPDGWLNFDASPTLRFERLPLIGRLHTFADARFPANATYGDIVRGLPIAEGSCEAVYCSHVLEHLSLADFRVAVANTLSYLRPGGTFRLVVPDLRQLAEDYLQSADPQAAAQFMDGSGLGHPVRARGAMGALRRWIGNSYHLWMWDFRSIASELTEAGFVDIREARFGDADDPMFALVEEEFRFEKALAVDCKAPT